MFVLDMQRRSALLIDASSMTKKFRGIFADMKNKNAKNMANSLHEARCLKDDIYERCETLEEYLNSESVQYENVVLINDGENFPNIVDYI